MNSGPCSGSSSNDHVTRRCRDDGLPRRFPPSGIQLHSDAGGVREGGRSPGTLISRADLRALSASRIWTIWRRRCQLLGFAGSFERQLILDIVNFVRRYSVVPSFSFRAVSSDRQTAGHNACMSCGPWKYNAAGTPLRQRHCASI